MEVLGYGLPKCQYTTYLLQSKKGVSYMILKNITEKAKSVWSSVSRVHIRAVHSYLTSCYQMVRAFGACLSQRFSKNRMIEPLCRICRRTSWNCGTVLVTALVFTRFDWLAGLSGKFLGLDKKFYHGKYLFTIDWAHPETNILDTQHSEIPQEHKCAHILELTNGNFAAQPNNRILWHVNSFTTDTSWPDYKVQTTYWNAENSNMVTEDSDRMFYEMKKKK
jgi:hypothetical protein